MRNFYLIMALLMTSPVMAQDTFLQGPERVGEVRTVSGTIIGVHHDLERACAVVLADQANAPAAAGLGGGGRFFVCSATEPFEIGKAWKGRVEQTGTRRARVGPRWRVLPLFERVG